MKDINYLIDWHVKESVTIHALLVSHQIHLLVQVVLLVIIIKILQNLVLKILVVIMIVIFVLLEIVYYMGIAFNVKLRPLIVKDVMQVLLQHAFHVLQDIISILYHNAHHVLYNVDNVFLNKNALLVNKDTS